jgi:hypothetical protein
MQSCLSRRKKWNNGSLIIRFAAQPDDAQETAARQARNNALMSYAKTFSLSILSIQTLGMHMQVDRCDVFL